MYYGICESREYCNIGPIKFSLTQIERDNNILLLSSPRIKRFHALTLYGTLLKSGIMFKVSQNFFLPHYFINPSLVELSKCKWRTRRTGRCF